MPSPFGEKPLGIANMVGKGGSGGLGNIVMVSEVGSEHKSVVVML